MSPDDFSGKVFGHVFELPVVRKAQKRDKKFDKK
jgi:hypothetical protein